GKIPISREFLRILWRFSEFCQFFENPPENFRIFRTFWGFRRKFQNSPENFQILQNRSKFFVSFSPFSARGSDRRVKPQLPAKRSQSPRLPLIIMCRCRMRPSRVCRRRKAVIASVL